MIKSIVRILIISIILCLISYTVILQEEIKIHKVNYEKYFLIGYLRATKDNKVIKKYTETHGLQNGGFYLYIVQQAVKDIREQIYKGKEAPTSIILEK